MLRIIISLLVLGTVSAGCQSEESAHIERPSWMEGTWTGRLSWEHDTTSYQLRLDLDGNRFAYPTLGCTGDVRIDSIGQNFARVELVAGADSLPCGEVGRGTAELRQLDEAGGLHLQYWPENGTELHLARLEPLRP